MADDRLRELERTFRRTGAVADEAVWLRARVQAGELTEGRLRLLAHLGHPAAVGLAPPGPNPLEVAGLDEQREIFDASWAWFAEVERLDPQALVAAGVVLGRHLLPICGPTHRGALAAVVEHLARVMASDPSGGGRLPREVGSDLERSFAEIPDSEAPPHMAAWALCMIGMGFCDHEYSLGPVESLANAAMGLESSCGSVRTPRELCASWAAEMIPLVLGL